MGFNAEEVKETIATKKALIQKEGDNFDIKPSFSEELKEAFAKKRGKAIGKNRLTTKLFASQSEKVTEAVNAQIRQVVEGEYYDAYAVANALNISEKESIKLVRKTLVETNLEQN